MSNHLHSPEKSVCDDYIQITVDSVEHQNELNRDAGWNLEYRQREPGKYSYRFLLRGRDEWFIVKENNSTAVDIHATSSSIRWFGQRSQALTLKLEVLPHALANAAYHRDTVSWPLLREYMGNGTGAL